MIRQNRKIQFIILLTLVCLVGTITIAYAVLSTTLNINGTAQVMDASWNVHFENIQVNPGSVAISPKITDNDKINFSADLTTPGQFYKFTVDIVNSGSIDAMIETVIINPELTDEQKKYLKYEVEYDDGSPINVRQLLKSGETKILSVFVSYRNDIPVSYLPKGETNLDLEIRLVYVQASSIGNEVAGNQRFVRVVSGDLNTIGSEIALGKEHFYLLSSSQNDVTMLAKYNLYVGGVYDGTNWIPYGAEATGMQDSTMIGFPNYPRYGVTAFSSDDQKGINYTDYKGSLVEKYINNYKDLLEKQGIIILNSRLITKDEAVELGCSVSLKVCNSSPYPWIYSTTYWLDSVHPNNITNIMFISSDSGFGHAGYMDDYEMGVRPVITIDKSYF